MQSYWSVPIIKQRCPEIKHAGNDSTVITDALFATVNSPMPIFGSLPFQNWAKGELVKLREVKTNELLSRNLKGESGLFLTPVLTLWGRRPYCPSRIEASYCTFGSGAIIWRDVRTLSLPRDSPGDSQYACVI